MHAFACWPRGAHFTGDVSPKGPVLDPRAYGVATKTIRQTVCLCPHPKARLIKLPSFRRDIPPLVIDLGGFRQVFRKSENLTETPQNEVFCEHRKRSVKIRGKSGGQKKRAPYTPLIWTSPIHYIFEYNTNRSSDHGTYYEYIDDIQLQGPWRGGTLI